MMPCENFYATLPRNETLLSWMTFSVTFTQPKNVFGNFTARMYFKDSSNGTSLPISLQFAIMESPCHNRAQCLGGCISYYVPLIKSYASVGLMGLKFFNLNDESFGEKTFFNGYQYLNFVNWVGFIMKATFDTILYIYYYISFVFFSVSCNYFFKVNHAYIF